MTVKFDPLPPRSGRPPLYDYDAIAEALIAAPNKWAEILPEAPATLPGSLRKGSIAALRPELGFRFAVRSIRMAKGRQVCSIWARHDPERRESQAVIAARRRKRAEDSRRYRAKQ